MQEGNKKEKWGKPKLLILTRGKPEERLLQDCKDFGLGEGPSGYDSTCAIALSGCPDCLAIVFS